MTFEEYLKAKDLAYALDSGKINQDVIINLAELWHKSELLKRSSNGGKNRASKLSPERRKEIAKMGSQARLQRKLK